MRVVLILEILHGLAYLWKAAKAPCAPEDPQAAQGVADKIEPRLHGQGHAIVRNLRRGATLQGMSPPQREPIAQGATSLAHHASSLTSPHSLAQGSPIATGVIEGACRSLVKDRMAIPGARWGREGGEALRKLRAL
jgi:hypothetical protein